MKNGMLMKRIFKSNPIALSLADRVVCYSMCRLRLAWKRTMHVPLVCTFSAHFKNGGPGGAHAEKRTRSIRKARCRLWPLAVIGQQLLPRPCSQSKPRNPTVEARRNSATSHNVTLRIDGRLVRAARGMTKPARLHAK